MLIMIEMGGRKELEVRALMEQLRYCFGLFLTCCQEHMCKLGLKKKRN